MPVELIAAWLVSQAYKLFVLPVAGNIQQRINNEIANKIVGAASNVFGAHGPASSKADAAVVPGTDLDLTKAIESQPQAGAALKGELEQVLGVRFGAGTGQWGTDEWFVSAYAAILWRVAMLAVWEGRPIAIRGALQGRKWVTVCAPGAGRDVIDPSTMWRQLDEDPRLLLRNVPSQPRVDFFVRQVTDDGECERIVAELNWQFKTEPTAAFKPTDAESIENGWHRIDGFSRTWVLLEPDANAAEAIRSKRTRPFVGQVDLRLHPPRYREYPPEWQPLLRIRDEPGGIAALSAGADEFSSASSAAAAAVEAALGG
jgi:hypothetical protein